jgi:hypothetical protein
MSDTRESAAGVVTDGRDRHVLAPSSHQRNGRVERPSIRVPPGSIGLDLDTGQGRSLIFHLFVGLGSSVNSTNRPTLPGKSLGFPAGRSRGGSGS